MSSFQPGLYKHIKGNKYYAYGTAIHSESKETMVIYGSADGTGDLWVRPLDMFTEMVESEQGLVPRFSFADEKV